MNFKGLKIEHKQLFVFIILGFVGVTFVIVQFIFKPTIEDIKNYRVTILNQKIELQDKLDRDRNMTKTNSKIEEITPHLDRFEEIYIDKNKVLEFITTLEGIASKNNVKQEIDLALDKTDNRNQYSRVPLKVSISGAYPNLKKYLEDIERLSYYTNIHSINLSLNRNPGSTTNNIPGSLIFDAFVYVK